MALQSSLDLLDAVTYAQTCVGRPVEPDPLGLELINVLSVRNEIQ
jgi:hypothetical protein